MARYLAKNLVASGVANELQIQIAYAIGIPQPVSVNVNTFGTSKIDLNDSEIGSIILRNFDLTPYGIQKILKLRDPIFKETASYGHFGRNPKKIIKTFESPHNGHVKKEVLLFSWEKLDLKSKMIKIFDINE